MVIAVIADIVGSRRLQDRAAAQQQLDDTIARVEARHPLALRPLRPTVGDEQQGVYTRLEDALISLLLVQLALPDGVEFRFGLGIGEVRALSSAHGELSDGTGWYAARDAIESVQERERAMPGIRSWIVGAPGQDEVMPSVIAASNAYLLLRDETVSRMSGRERRLTLGRMEGLSQQDLAEQEGVTQPSVSKALRGSGATVLIAGVEQLRGALA
ncbi:SatD family protein [Microbacterium sp. KUDC0406]|uniref:SatD family protein n=1 Tax=Microbacterium sp. KUDC0406 TaxID=2909588 RepID=UPI001F36C773|nr:SatD family protein [Microbacterium sp. KUDC0406]UJP10672.1 SatD family protein [Microbacterium sp. KUDC0406]